MGRFQQSKSLLLSVDRVYLQLRTEVLSPIFNTNIRNNCIILPWPFFLVMHTYTNCVLLAPVFGDKVDIIKSTALMQAPPRPYQQKLVDKQHLAPHKYPASYQAQESSPGLGQVDDLINRASASMCKLNLGHNSWGKWRLNYHRKNKSWPPVQFALVAKQLCMRVFCSPSDPCASRSSP